MLLLGACTNAERGGAPAPGLCEDRDGDGYGRDCANGYDCDDGDRNVTHECRSCAQPDHGCPCSDEGAVESCFLPARELAGGKLECAEGTRACRGGVWSRCEDVHHYVLDKPAETQGIIVPSAGRETCNSCDLKCFKVIDDLLVDGGVAGGSVTFGPHGGLVLQPGDGGVPADAGDAGSISDPGCAGLTACCATFSGTLRIACTATVNAGDAARCETEKATYCPSGTITGPVPSCTPGTGADTDCDGIPDAVDNLAGRPLDGTNNQTIFHQLDIGETGENAIDVSFRLRNADVYFMLDTTGTMLDERDNLLSTLTSGNVVNCAQLGQCCGTDATCASIVAANNQTNCYAAQPTYCGGQVDCADADLDGAPDNHLKTQGVIGAVRCLVGTSWFGTGHFREIPAHDEPEPTPVWDEGQRYGDRDEQVFRHLIDMTPDYERVRTALASMSMNYNWDEPEGGYMALYSLASGKGHYLGINRPAVADRSAAQGCRSSDDFGYACFRKDAVPIVVFLTDAPHHNGPGSSTSDPTNCNGRGAGCPYSDLTSLNSWTSGSSESASDRTAHYVSQRSEGFGTAFSVGDVRGKYFSLVGNTQGMTGDYPTSIIGCGAASNAPDALVTFRVGAGADIPVHIKLTKNDAYDRDLYGRWNPTWLASGTDDPTPATEFGAVISLFRGVPSAVSTTVDVMAAGETVVASGPDGAYLRYVGTTDGSGSSPGLWGGISGCAADGQTNQAAFSFRPGADARIVFDATTSSYPVTLSLHDSKPSSLPTNPAGTGITNDNDTFASAHVLPSATMTIDGAYVERIGDSNVLGIDADYTARHTLRVSGARTNGSREIRGVSHPNVLYPGLPLEDATGWSSDPVTVASVSGNVATMSARWNGATDSAATTLAFDDSLVGCNADPAASETVFQFDVATPRRVRIDTEGSSFDTVISLHDGPPVTSVTRNDVSGNGVAPGYDLGELTSKVFRLSDVGTGTSSLPNTYDFVQCGAAAAAQDAVFRFELAKQTRIGLDVASSTWNPIVGLFAATPGQATILTNANTNDRIAPPAQDALQLGNVLGQVSTRVNGSTLSGMADDIPSTTVGCGALAGGRDQIFKFTTSGSTTMRVQATPSVSGFYPVVSVFDGPPPVTATPTVTQAYDVSAVTLPESNCQAFSYHDPATGTAAPHVYAVCPSRRYANDANTRCANAGMNYLAVVSSAAEQAFLGSLVAGTSINYGHHIGAHIPSGSTFLWRDGSALTYTNWASGEPNDGTHTCAAMQKGGRWEDKRCTSTSASADDATYYLCEDIAPAVMPAENLLTAQTVDPLGKVESVQGSTLRMYDDYNGATLLGTCGGTVGAGDAVFKIVTGASGGFTLSADTTGSTYSPVIGLFEATIDAAGFKACDAAGGAPLTYTLLSGRTYFLVVDGTAASPEGSYKLKLADTTALANSGLRLSCGAGNMVSAVASTDVEVEANHTYYVVVDSATATLGGYDLQLSALHQSRATLGNSSPTNERGVSAFELPDPYRSKIVVKDTTTGGMAGDYGSSVICSADGASPDAVYKLRPSVSTGLKLTVTPQGSGLTTPVIGLFDGPPVTTPVLHDLAADGNLNDSVASAEVVSFGSSTRRYDGSTAAMAADTDPALAACGSSPTAPDAMFAFTLAESTEVEIDASASAIADPVLRLFRDGPRARPAAVALQYDDRASADAASLAVDGAWLQLSGDMAGLTSEAQIQSSVAADNDDSASPMPAPQDLGDVAGRRVTVGGADTTAMAADYPGVCGAAVGGRDVVYRFHSSTATTLHVKATPAAGLDLALGLYEGPNGPPLRRIDSETASTDRTCTGAPAAAPSNLSVATLYAIGMDAASAPDVSLSCATPSIDTTDPDGSGIEVVTFGGWCGATPLAYVQPQAGGPDAVVLLMRSLDIPLGTSLRVIGDRPLILVVTQGATVAGAIDANGDTASARPGAGGDVGCGSSRGGDAATASGYSGGGGGGGFGTAGGLGGSTTAAGGLAGGAAGSTRGNAALVPLLGGCNGGRSGATVATGVAGGAVQLSVLGTLDLTGGTVRARGSNGVLPSFTNLGGSGGGSGGAILLEAGTLTFDPLLLDVAGGNGASGAGSGTAASGGSGSGDAMTPGAAGMDGEATRSGGGGGGGYGRVRSEQRALSLEPCSSDAHEDAAQAVVLDLASSGRTHVELGSTQYMRNDHDVTGCGAAADAHDAVFAFTLPAAGEIEIDATGSDASTVVGLFEASALLGGGAATTCFDDSAFQKTTTLPAGDYRIVVSSRDAASGGAYALRVGNRSHALNAAAEVACDASSGELVHALQANTPYYLVVKGLDASEAGAYGLVVETPGAGASMGCGTSAEAADAVYRLHVASPREVSIDTEGSATDTVIALYPSSASAFDTDYATDASGVGIECDDDGGVSPGASRLDAALAAGDYYLVVKRKSPTWSSAAQPFRVSVRDGEATSAIACASGSIAAKKIVQVLPAGDYRVVVSSESATGGAYSVKFRDVSHFGVENGVQLACVSGAGNTLTYPSFEAGRDYYVVVKGNAASESGAYELTVEDTVSLSAAAGSTAVACAAEGSRIDGVYPPGTYYALVSGNAAGAAGTYTLQVQDLDAQNDQNRLACDDDGGPNSTSAIEAELQAGTHYVVVKGKTVADRGGYRLHVRDVDTVDDHRLACAGGPAGTARIEYDVRAGQDYTLLVKGGAEGAEGSYALNMYDSVSAPSASGSRLACEDDPQPTPLRGSTWDRRKIELSQTLAPDTYYVAVKGVRESDAGHYQLQIGQTTARTSVTYQPPTWPTTRDALVASGVRVLPVIATGGDSSDFVPAAEAQAKLLAQATGAVRADGTPIWQRISRNGTGTGTGLVAAIAELAAHLSMDVSLTAADGPDPGASRFQVHITPQNSPNCTTPHPLVDASGACSSTAGPYNCQTQYDCRPGASPRFRVTFTNPESAPVPPNPDNQYGGYLFKLQLKGDGKYLLDEIPVFIIPTNKPLPPPPGTYQSEGVYTQDIDATSCKLERQLDGSYEFNPRSTDLPQWRDLFFKADIPEGSSIEFELCARDDVSALASCDWSDSAGSTRTKIEVTSQGECTSDSHCVGVPDKGNGFCSDFGTCQFVSLPKVLWDLSCSDDSSCENGLFGAGDYTISSHCERTPGNYGYGHCVYHSVPLDIGSTLLPTEDGRLFSRIRITLRANAAGNATPTLYEWYMTYRCQSSL